MMNKIKLIEETFKTINKVTNGRFSTLRNLDLIPESSSLENDIDLLIPSVYVKQVVEAVKSSSYQIYQDNSPCLYGAHPHIHFKHSTLDVHFDIMTGMYYIFVESSRWNNSPPNLSQAPPKDFQILPSTAKSFQNYSKIL